jgi:hypothetical protein
VKSAIDPLQRHRCNDTRSRGSGVRSEQKYY